MKMTIKQAQELPDWVELGKAQQAKNAPPTIDPNAPPVLTQDPNAPPVLTQDPNAPPTFTQPANTGKSSYQFSASSSDDVKEMQQAIVNFGNTLAANPIMSMQQSGTQEQPGTQGTNFLGGSTPFGNFLVNQYVNNAELVGKQFVNVGLPEPQRTGSSIPNVDLKGIVQTISYIGTPGHEQQPDGIWQGRTNNALKQIYAVGKAMMQFANDMKFNIKRFSDQDLATLGSNIPQAYTDLKNGEASSRAKIITPLINKLTSLYKVFQSTILEHPDLKSLINQDKPFLDHSQITQHNLAGDDSAFYQANQEAVIPGANVNGKPVHLKDLASTIAFRHFLKDANVDINNFSEVAKQIAAIKSVVNTEFGAGF